jgi:hypothetical protein
VAAAAGVQEAAAAAGTMKQGRPREVAVPARPANPMAAPGGDQREAAYHMAVIVRL